MSRDLSELHPTLREAAQKLIAAYGREFPGRELRVVCTHRTTAEQVQAHACGASRADGVNTFSPHNYLPSLAVDFGVFIDGRYQSDRIYYERLGGLVEALWDKRLRWGGDFREFFDGPHVEIKPVAVIGEFQRMLVRAGVYRGKVDGIWGNASRLALRAVCGETKRTPAAWAALWAKYGG